MRIDIVAIVMEFSWIIELPWITMNCHELLLFWEIILWVKALLIVAWEDEIISVPRMARKYETPCFEGLG